MKGNFFLCLYPLQEIASRKTRTGKVSRSAKSVVSAVAGSTADCGWIYLPLSPHELCLREMVRHHRCRGLVGVVVSTFSGLLYRG